MNEQEMELMELHADTYRLRRAANAFDRAASYLDRGTFGDSAASDGPRLW